MPLEDIFIYLGNLQLKHIELQQCYYICRDPKSNMVSEPNCKCNKTIKGMVLYAAITYQIRKLSKRYSWTNTRQELN